MVREQGQGSVRVCEGLRLKLLHSENSYLEQGRQREAFLSPGRSVVVMVIAIVVVTMIVIMAPQ